MTDLRNTYAQGVFQACKDAGLTKQAGAGKFSIPLALLGGGYGAYHLATVDDKEKQRKKQTAEEILQRVRRGY